MRPTSRFLILGIVFPLVLALAACEGDVGPQGPAGPPGTTSEFTFIGGQGEPCSHCHQSTVNQWMQTGHFSATTDLPAGRETNPYCMQCHTTGWDSRLASNGQTLADVTRGADVNGYDDYFGIDTPEAAQRRADLAGVQCEACHGASGPDFNRHKAVISFSTHQVDGEWTSLCYPCHTRQLEEWNESPHALYDPDTGTRPTVEEFNGEHYAHNSSCDYCHTSEGFIRANDPRYATYEFPEERSFIGCVTCHDPHKVNDQSGGIAQLRNVGAVEVEYHPGFEDGDPGLARMSGKGGGQTCAQCHHARRNTANVTGQIANGTQHFGPHGNPQMDMYLGAGSYEIAGYSYDGRYDTITRTTHYDGIGNACVTCHMGRALDSEDHAIHTFTPNLDIACGGENCHGGAPTGLVTNLTNELNTKMDTLAVLLGFADHTDYEANWNSRAAGVTPRMREAAYAMTFVLNDGSHGVHNPKYARDLIDNAIDYLSNP